MNDAFFHESHEPIGDLPKNFDRFLLRHRGMLLNNFFKVCIAELLNDVVVIGTFHDFKDWDYVFRFNLLKDFYLFKKGSFEVFVGVDWIEMQVLVFLLMILIAQGFFVCSCSPLYTYP